MTVPLFFELLMYVVALGVVFYFSYRTPPKKHPIYSIGDKVWLISYGHSAWPAVVVGVDRSRYFVRSAGSEFSADIVRFRDANKRLLRRVGA